ncbi:hypothetical protein EDC01DRAFT_634170 [Geopyxis carbonaria]|nr:hypothetical protein EDC01DRAFT_634170 [Geopyxis carbonaria]
MSDTTSQIIDKASSSKIVTKSAKEAARSASAAVASSISSTVSQLPSPTVVEHGSKISEGNSVGYMLLAAAVASIGLVTYISLYRRGFKKSKKNRPGQDEVELEPMDGRF